MFANPAEVKCAACGKEVFVSSAFLVKELDTGKGNLCFLCGECYDKLGKEEEKK